MEIESLKWNKMVDLWVEEKLDSPYAELLTYDNEVNNGGHWQFFDNVSETDNLDRVVKVLLEVLPVDFKHILKSAYEEYKKDPDDEEGNLTPFLDKCDNFYYENCKKVESILQQYANTLSL